MYIFYLTTVCQLHSSYPPWFHSLYHRVNLGISTEPCITFLTLVQFICLIFCHSTFKGTVTKALSNCSTVVTYINVWCAVPNNRVWPGDIPDPVGLPPHRLLSVDMLEYPRAYLCRRALWSSWVTTSMLPSCKAVPSDRSGKSSWCIAVGQLTSRNQWSLLGWLHM